MRLFLLARCPRRRSAPRAPSHASATAAHMATAEAMRRRIERGACGGVGCRYRGRFAVSNLGVSGATLQRDGNLPYWSQTASTELLGNAQDVVIRMLGTNDARRRVMGARCELAARANGTAAARWARRVHTGATISSSSNACAPPRAGAHIFRPSAGCHARRLRHQRDGRQRAAPAVLYDIAASAGIPTDHVIDVFGALGGRAVPPRRWSPRQRCTLADADATEAPLKEK